MAYMTLADYRTDLQSALGDKGIDNSRMDRWINFGYHDLAGSVDFEVTDQDETVATVQSTQTIAVPTGTEIVKLIKDTSNDALLGWIPKAEMFRRAVTPTGPPTHWSRHGNLIYFHPVPNAVINMFIIHKLAPDRMTNVADVSVFSDIWDPAIFLLTVHHGLLALGEDQRSASWLGRAISYIQTRMTEVDMHSQASGLGASIPTGMESLQNRLGSMGGT